MRTLLRVVAVVVSTVVFLVLATLVLLIVDTAQPGPETEFGFALASAQGAAWDGGTGPMPSVCGFPSASAGSYVLSHREVVAVARCLHQGGDLSAAALAEIEQSDLSLAGGCPEESATTAPSPVRPGRTVTTCGGQWMGGGGIDTREWWVTGLIVVGLVVVVWFVGFRLPWWRRPDPSGRSA